MTESFEIICNINTCCKWTDVISFLNFTRKLFVQSFKPKATCMKSFSKQEISPVCLDGTLLLDRKCEDSGIVCIKILKFRFSFLLTVIGRILPLVVLAMKTSILHMEIAGPSILFWSFGIMARGSRRTHRRILLKKRDESKPNIPNYL